MSPGVGRRPGARPSNTALTAVPANVAVFLIMSTAQPPRLLRRHPLLELFGPIDDDLNLRGPARVNDFETPRSII